MRFKELGSNCRADTDGQPTVADLAKQFRRGDAHLVNKGSIDLLRTQGSRCFLLVDPFPSFGFRADIRSERHGMLRFMGEYGIIQGLAKKVKVQCGAAGVR